MDLKNIPDRRRKRVPKKITVAVSVEAFQNAEYLRAKGKNVGAFLNPLVERELAKAAGKKAG
jgi:hypothetical protein